MLGVILAAHDAHSAPVKEPLQDKSVISDRWETSFAIVILQGKLTLRALFLLSHWYFRIKSNVLKLSIHSQWKILILDNWTGLEYHISYLAAQPIARSIWPFSNAVRKTMRQYTDTRHTKNCPFPLFCWFTNWSEPRFVLLDKYIFHNKWNFKILKGRAKACD